MIHKLTAQICEIPEMIYILEQGSELYRCRPTNSNIPYTQSELGPAPKESARANRMSPAGIPMFYGSENKDTALIEVADESSNFGIGKFNILKDLTLIDFTNIENIKKEYIEFLLAFLNDFTKRIERNDSVHIEYVPTQMFTEYLRDCVDYEGRQINGIKYYSSRNKNGICYVLFTK